MIALALAGGFAYFWFSPSQVLKRAVEREGSAIAGSAVQGGGSDLVEAEQGLSRHADSRSPTRPASAAATYWSPR
ncbi:MAG: hypothetical protein MZW92_13390 [Comamonadaceae bacterium]|nr:hypothetical protein [Comamonadaceae bacterium]